MDLRIKEILAQRGIKLKDFAQMSGISLSNLSNYLNCSANIVVHYIQSQK